MSISENQRFFGNTEFSRTEQSFSTGFNSITPVHGLDGKDGRDGRDGRDGVDGRNGLDGRDGVDGRNGLDGRDGTDGYTPVRGVDYWTESDRSEMIKELAQAVGLPAVTTADNGKILQVVNGIWTLVPLQSGGTGAGGADRLGQGLLGSMILGGV
ncbi:MAG: hypothetical protein IKU72_02065 [Oscillospiraceae bacterium]|nr:hypothetical protein [Oscillospiraceae bacterium]